MASAWEGRRSAKVVAASPLARVVANASGCGCCWSFRRAGTGPGTEQSTLQQYMDITRERDSGNLDNLQADFMALQAAQDVPQLLANARDYQRMSLVE